jgi:PD-(D/E)XK endonuclease
VKRRKARIIKEPKARGEWGESVFMVQAVEHGLPVSRPWGESNSFDFVVGKPGRFVSVQVQSTTVKNGMCALCARTVRNMRAGRSISWQLMSFRKTCGT